MLPAGRLVGRAAAVSSWRVRQLQLLPLVVMVWGVLAVTVDAQCHLRQHRSHQPWIARIGSYLAGARIGDPSLYGNTDSFEWRCAGSLINKRVVLTAAHCLTGPSTDHLVVRLGEYNTYQTLGCEVDRKVVSTVVHPGYGEKPGAYHDDVALLLLNATVPLSDHIRLIQLVPPEVSVPVGTKVVMGGWGDQLFLRPESTACVLKRAIRKLVDFDICEKLYVTVDSKIRFPFGVNSDELFCVSNGQDNIMCQGDSGGPAAISLDSTCDVEKINNTCPHVLFGMVGYGFGCGHPMYPSLGVSLPRYRLWIELMVKVMLRDEKQSA